jgi:hypothetical protein
MNNEIARIMARLLLETRTQEGAELFAYKEMRKWKQESAEYRFWNEVVDALPRLTDNLSTGG